MNDNFLHKLAQAFPNAWVITATASKIELGTFAHLAQKLASISPALRIVHQQTLTHELDWQSNNNLSQADQVSAITTLQWIVTGELDSQNTLIQKSKAILQENSYLDINVMPLATYLRPHKLALFDMDSTLIEQEVIVELAKKAGIGEQVNTITESAMRGEIDFAESFTRRVALLKDLSSDVLDDIIAHQITFSLGARRLIQALKNNGYHVVLVSGGFTFFAEYVQRELGIDEIYANALDIVDDKLTGRITSPIVDAKRKAEILQEVSERLGIKVNETVAVGDGANDLPMLALADIGIAYHAKPVVREQADYGINVAGLDGVIALLGLTI